jgi:hypothetical protein
MFDASKLEELENGGKSNGVVSKTTLSGLNIHELLALRAEIDAYLPEKAMKDMNLEEELMMQYHQTKALLAEVIVDTGTPTNQKAQVINTCNNILAEITKSQTVLYNSQRLKVMEQALINALNGVDPVISDKFFALYSAELEKVS